MRIKEICIYESDGAITFSLKTWQLNNEHFLDSDLISENISKYTGREIWVPRWVTN